MNACYPALILSFCAIQRQHPMFQCIKNQVLYLRLSYPHRENESWDGKGARQCQRVVQRMQNILSVV